MGSSLGSTAGSLTSPSSRRSSRSRFDSLVGHDDVDDDVEVPPPGAAQPRHALALRRISRPDCEPAGTSTSSLPSTVGTVSVAPSAACGNVTGSSW